MASFVTRITGSYMNPAFPIDADFYDVGQVAYVLFKSSEARTRPTRVLTSYGPLQMRDPDNLSVVTRRALRLGDIITLNNDQSGSWVGDYRVAGIHHFATGSRVGDVPDRKLKHSVAK